MSAGSVHSALTCAGCSRGMGRVFACRTWLVLHAKRAHEGACAADIVRAFVARARTQDDGVWRFVDYQLAEAPEALMRAKEKELTELTGAPAPAAGQVA